jgi:hypothetical protein
MAETDKNGLVLFKNYLGLKPVKGSFPPPYSIKAEDLDNNFRRVSVSSIQGDGHTVEVTENGTILKYKTATISIGGRTLELIVVS